MFNNSEKKDQVRKSPMEILKSVWKLEVEDDIYIITIYLSAIIYYKGKNNSKHIKFQQSFGPALDLHLGLSIYLDQTCLVP